MSKKLGENVVGTAGQNWPKLALFQAHQENWMGGWASGRWQLPLQNLFPLPSLPSLTVPLSQPFAVPILSCIPSREAGSSWALSCWPRLALANCTIWATSYFFFFSIYIQFAEESVHTDWWFLNLGIQLCLFQDQPSCNFANWLLFHISTTFKVSINIPTTEFNYSKTNMLLSVNPCTLHSWKMLFQAKKTSTHKNGHDAFSINYFCYMELCFHVALCYK